MPDISLIALIGGGPTPGVLCSAYKASRFDSLPVAYDTPVPTGAADATGTSGNAFGGPGQVSLTVPTFEEYWVAIPSGGHIGWVKSPTPLIPESDVSSLLSDLAFKAPLASPTFTGIVTAPVANIASAAFAGKPVYHPTHPTFGADSTGVADSTTGITNAINAALAAAGGGVVDLLPGTYWVTAPLPPITKANVSLGGGGTSNTVIKYTGSGTCLRVQTNPFTIHPASPLPAVAGSSVTGFTIDGSGASAGAVGLEYGDIVSGNVDVKIQYFDKAGSVGLWLHNAIGWSERNRVKASVSSCTTLVKWSKNDSDDSTVSFGYNEYDFQLEINNGQKGMSFQSAAGGSLGFYSGRMSAQANMGGTSTFIEMTGNAVATDNQVDLRAEGPPATATFANIASTAYWRGTGVAVPGNVGAVGIMPIVGQFTGSYIGLNTGQVAVNTSDTEHVVRGWGLGGTRARLQVQNGSAASKAGIAQDSASKLFIEANGTDIVMFDPTTHTSSFYAQIYPSTPVGTTQALAGLFANSGAPSNANGNNGDYFFRSDGGAGAAMYQKRSGVWVELTYGLAPLASPTFTGTVTIPDAVNPTDAAQLSDVTDAVTPLPLGTLAYVPATADQNSITTAVDLTGLTATVTVGAGRRIRISAEVLFLSSAGGTMDLLINEGATQFQLGRVTIGAGAMSEAFAFAILTPTAGSHTYKLRAQGSGSGGSAVMGADHPGFILVEDIGV